MTNVPQQRGAGQTELPQYKGLAGQLVNSYTDFIHHAYFYRPS